MDGIRPAARTSPREAEGEPARTDARVIAVDFDGTLCEDRWPEIGRPYMEIINDLRQRRAEFGVKLILWTCREGAMLAEAVGWCKAFGLHFDAVNCNLPEHIEHYDGDCRKVYADLYIDDRCQVARDGRLIT